MLPVSSDTTTATASVDCEPFDNGFEVEDDEAGYCKAHEWEIVYLDDDSWCDDFVAVKSTRVRGEDWD